MKVSGLLDLEHFDIYDLKIYSNNLYIPIVIKSKKPKIVGIFPGRKFFNIDPINKEQARVRVHTKLIIIADKGGILILDVPYAMLATKESIHKEDTNNSDSSIKFTS